LKLGGRDGCLQPKDILDKETIMNRDQVKGNWNQVKGEVKRRWGKLSDDDLDVVDGEYDKLVGKLQERHGLEREQAKKEVDALYDTL